MIVCISQPRYLPFLGYFHRLSECDLWIHLDTVQYSPRDYENRNKIKTPQGWTWLSIPVNSRYRAMIPEVRINYEHCWQYKHWETISMSYRRAPYFVEHVSRLEPLYRDSQWEFLRDLNIESTVLLCELLGIKRPRFMRASELNAEGAGSDLILNLCREVGATYYLSGSEGRNYLNVDSFRDAGIKLRIQNYQHPQYPQQFGSFEPYMAVIDLLLNCGPDSLNILRRHQAFEDI
tara:strand:- start:327 stop:1028 length:702 start_codon:yes stop_codon:yes gene_type:complete